MRSGGQRAQRRLLGEIETPNVVLFRQSVAVILCRRQRAELHMDLEDVWRTREEDVFPTLFGHQFRGILPLQMEMFTHQFGQSEIDPRWLHYGVFEFAPTGSRRSGLYVTSGHSNPWEQAPADYDPEGESGKGVEFTLATTEPGEWAVTTLQSMLAFDLQLWAGRFPGREYIGVGDRIPLRAPLNGQAQCALRNLLMTEAGGIASEFQLPSVKVILTGFTAVTDAEFNEANQQGSSALIDRLRGAGFHPVNDPHRRQSIA